MLPGERDLYRRFAAYDDEELQRILTVERAKYRREALRAAEMVLTQRARGMTPAPDTAPVSHAPQAQARPKSPYELPDLFVDAFLVMLAVWGWKKLWVWTEAPYWVWPLGSVAYWGLTFAFLCSIYSLRRKWRSL